MSFKVLSNHSSAAYFKIHHGKQISIPFICLINWWFSSLRQDLYRTKLNNAPETMFKLQVYLTLTDPIRSESICSAYTGNTHRYLSFLHLEIGKLKSYWRHRNKSFWVNCSLLIKLVHKNRISGESIDFERKEIHFAIERFISKEFHSYHLRTGCVNDLSIYLVQFMHVTRSGSITMYTLLSCIKIQWTQQKKQRETRNAFHSLKPKHSRESKYLVIRNEMFVCVCHTSDWSSKTMLLHLFNLHATVFYFKWFRFVCHTR